MKLFVELCLIVLLTILTLQNLPPTHANADDKIDDAEAAAAEKEMQAMHKELADRKAAVKNDYEENKTSEDAHMKYFFLLLSEQKYADAQIVLESWKGLDPQSKRVAVLGSQLKELSALGKTRAPTEMRRRHMEELSKAAMDDAVARTGGISGTDLSKLTSGDSSTFMKTAQDLNNKRKAEFKSKYPDVCERRLSAADQMKEWDAKSKVMNIETERGKQGLRAEFPVLYKEHPDFQTLAQDYAQFLLRDNNFDEASVVVKAGRKNFPKSLPFVILENGLAELEKVKSIEQKKALVFNIDSELTLLMLVEIDCK